MSESPADNLFDADYHIPYPLRVLVNINARRPREDGMAELLDPAGLETLDNTDGTKSLPVFTDLDLLQRCVEESGGVPDAVSFKVSDHVRFLAILDSLVGRVSFVAFDPPRFTGDTPRSFPLDYVRQRLRSLEGPSCPNPADS